MSRNHEKEQRKWSILNFLGCGSMAKASSITRRNPRPASALAPPPVLDNTRPRSWLSSMMMTRPRNSNCHDRDMVTDRNKIRRTISTPPTDVKQETRLSLGDWKRDMMVNNRRKSLSYLQTRAKLMLENREDMMLVDRRRSISQVVDQTNIGKVVSVLQVKVLESDMPELMQVHALQWARKIYHSLEEFSFKHMAFDIKREFDGSYGPAWHCIVGSNFGSFVTHGIGCFLYFSIENDRRLYVLLFRTKIQRPA